MTYLMSKLAAEPNRHDALPLRQLEEERHRKLWVEGGIVSSAYVLTMSADYPHRIWLHSL